VWDARGRRENSEGRLAGMMSKFERAGTVVARSAGVEQEKRSRNSTIFTLQPRHTYGPHPSQPFCHHNTSSMAHVLTTPASSSLPSATSSSAAASCAMYTYHRAV